MFYLNSSNTRILLVVRMGGIPHIYDSPFLFHIYNNSEDIIEIENEEYEELCEKIEQHLIEEKRLLKRIKQMELV